jgi:peptidoglycan/LPS O-acetylase OafA/YrhL
MLAIGRDRLGRWLADRPSQFLGRVSYSLYLIHSPVLGAVVVAMTAALPHSTASQFVAAGTGIAVSCGAALVMYRLVEQPAIQWSRSLRRP